VKIEIKLQVDADHLANVLCSGFESGIRYWGMLCDATQHELPVELPVEPRMLRYHQALISLGFIKVKVQDTGRLYHLTSDKVLRGIQVIANRYPRHLGAVLGDSSKQDAETGDVLIQCALFGEVRYG
jgi:hypothetical protein